MRNPMRYRGWSDTEDERSWLNWPRGFLLKLDNAETKTEIQKSKPRWKKSSEEAESER